MKNKATIITGNIARRIAALAVALATVFCVPGCSEDEGRKDYLYTVGIEEYSYSGETLFGPLTYLSGLDIPERFTVSSGRESDADAQALLRFEAEMAKIDPVALDAYGKYYFRYVLFSTGQNQTIAEREFGGR